MVSYFYFRYGNTSYDIYKVTLNKSMKCGWNSMEFLSNGIIQLVSYWTFISMTFNYPGILLFTLINFQRMF